MRVLLDTHAFLWWTTDDERLSLVAKHTIADDRNEIFVSAASAWEIATKRRLGKLDGTPLASERFSERVSADGFVHLPVNHLHALRAGTYPLGHRDPVDRILAAQSELQRLPLLTCDAAFLAFGIQTI